MFFITDRNSIFSCFKGKQRNKIIFHKLRRDRTTDQGGKFSGTQGEVLFDLNDSKLIGATLRLYWKNILRAMLIQTNINFISLDLSHIGHGCSQVIL